jgi:hypothetical protein
MAVEDNHERGDDEPEDAQRPDDAHRSPTRRIGRERRVVEAEDADFGRRDHASKDDLARVVRLRRQSFASLKSLSSLGLAYMNEILQFR